MNRGVPSNEEASLDFSLVLSRNSTARVSKRSINKVTACSRARYCTSHFAPTFEKTALPSRTNGPPPSDSSSATVNECAATTEMVRRSCSFCPLAVTGSIAKRIEIGLVQSPLLESVAPLPSFSVQHSVFGAYAQTIHRLSL